MTPAASQGALKGITRGAILDIATDSASPIREADLTRYDLWCADECFLTGRAPRSSPCQAGRPRDRHRQARARHPKRVARSSAEAGAGRGHPDLGRGPLP
jgi:branched-subunit amino acid aminotransferase/4-amino-4-deoxychorismate lyase